MANRLVLALSAAVLLASTPVLAACGKNSDEPGASSKPEDNSPYTFTIMHNDGGNAYIKSIAGAKENLYVKEMSRLFSEYSKKPTTIQFEYLPSADYSQQLTVRFVSRDVPEVVSTTSISDKGHPTAIQNGVFLQLNELIDKYGPNLKKKIPPYVWDSPRVSQNGKIYGIPALVNPISPTALYVRQDYLDKLGITKQPETAEEFLAFFEKVKTTDLNGNGKHDEVGYAMRGGFGFSNAFFAMYKLFPGSWQMVDGKYTPDIVNPKMKEAVGFYKQLFDKGYIDKDFINAKDADWTSMIKNGRAAVWSHDLRNIGSSWGQANFENKDVKLGLLPGFKQADGNNYLQPRGLGISKVDVIISTAKNPERIVQFLDWQFSDDPIKTKFHEFGIKDRNYTEVNGKVKWDPAGEFNKNGESGFYQASLNQAGDTRMDIPVVEAAGAVDLNVLKKGLEYIEKNQWDDISINMPAPEAIRTNPELDYGAGSLFLDMLLKVITGKVPLDSGFNSYVAEWKKKGGEKAIDEATQWYNSQKK
ncbi:extracellular solute-binding protein [Paenibacillus koleovorans]|uniref:extracellular solute-binding protein n=1 Tax=Paenibacillus koleovorans TaxID=121608 RepID=UPI000FDC0C12|nr:extracellular solute-binding protein [Paenibacillus koleovorans]